MKEFSKFNKVAYKYFGIARSPTNPYGALIESQELHDIISSMFRFKGHGLKFENKRIYSAT